MHEMTLLNGLMKQIERIAQTYDTERVSVVRVKLGALAHISPDHFREHFEHAARGTIVQDATLEVEQLHDIHHPKAQDIVLDSLDIEEKDNQTQRAEHV